MKPVLGFLFLLAGFTVGYLVLTGKLPNSSATPAATPTTPAATTTPNTPVGRPGNVHSGYSGGSLGLPTMAALDMPGSRGGMR